MADDEGRREEYRIEAYIDRALRNGTWGKCFLCGDPTPHRERTEIDREIEIGRWACKACQHMMTDPGD